MEIIDIVDDNGEPTGETVDRQAAHANGIRHRTAHVWLLRRRPGGVQVLLQKRSAGKDSHPGCYDISSAGHIPAGVDYVPSALRELKEELGIELDPSQLHRCGQRRIYHESEFYGRPFIDHQVSNVYFAWLDIEPEQMTLQAEEVEAVVWMDLEACKAAVQENRFPNCIVMEELEMLQKSYYSQRSRE